MSTACRLFFAVVCITEVTLSLTSCAPHQAVFGFGGAESGYNTGLGVRVCTGTHAICPLQRDRPGMRAGEVGTVGLERQQRRRRHHHARVQVAGVDLPGRLAQALARGTRRVRVPGAFAVGLPSVVRLIRRAALLGLHVTLGAAGGRFYHRGEDDGERQLGRGQQPGELDRRCGCQERGARGHVPGRIGAQRQPGSARAEMEPARTAGIFAAAAFLMTSDSLVSALGGCGDPQIHARYHVTGSSRPRRSPRVRAA